MVKRISTEFNTVIFRFFHMFIFYLTTYGGTLILPYGIPNDHACWVSARSWGFPVYINAYAVGYKM
jgi:hypothetical protein